MCRLKLLQFNSEHESSIEDWSLPIRTSYQNAIIYWQFRRRLVIISPSLEPSRFLFRVIWINDTGTFPAFGIRANGALSSFTRLSSCIARFERPWTSLPMSSATPADFIDVRASKARAPHLGFDRTEILPCVLKKRFHCLSVYRFAPQDRPAHVTRTVHFPSLISQKLMIYCLIQNRLFQNTVRSIRCYSEKLKIRISLSVLYTIN